MQNHAVFFDRDNTINFDPGYLGDPNQVKLFPGVIEGIKKLRQQYKFKIIDHRLDIIGYCPECNKGT